MVGEGREGGAPATAHQPLSLQSISSQEFPAKEATGAGPGKVSGAALWRAAPPKGRGRAPFPPAPGPKPWRQLGAPARAASTPASARAAGRTGPLPLQGGGDPDVSEGLK